MLDDKHQNTEEDTIELNKSTEITVEEVTSTKEASGNTTTADKPPTQRGEVESFTDEDTPNESTESFVYTDERRYCNQCGARIPVNSIFCPKCGCKLEGLSEDSATKQAESHSSSTSENIEPQKTPSKMPSAGMLLGFAAAAIVIFAMFSCAGKPNLRNAYNKYCSSIFAEIATDGSYLKIDTNPYDFDSYSDSEAMTAIENVNSALHLPESVLSRMNSTRALDGTQSYTDNHLEVYWKYHPDNGLEVTYSVK